MNSEELDFYVTKRLLDFYDGLLERGQLDPPMQGPAKAVPDLSHCRETELPSLSLLQSEDGSRRSFLDR
jgi:hypothetical protein